MDAQKEYLKSLKAMNQTYKRLQKTLETMTKTLEKLVQLHEKPKSQTIEKPKKPNQQFYVS